MNKSLKKNITYNIVSQTVALLVPLIVTPYIARVFNAELLGAYGYAYANSSYFVLLECLGFPLYGQIRISVDRDDINQRSAVFWEITLLKIVFMILCLALYFFIVILNTDGMVFRLSVIMTLNIVSNGIDTTWILNGLEDFKAVAIRNVLIRGINILLIFLLVKKENDIYTYAVIMQIATLVAFIMLIPRTLTYVKRVPTKSIKIKKHIKPAGVYFIPSLVTTIFSSTDKTMLGFFSNKYEVGVYEQANKLVLICMGAVSAGSNVIMPRAAYLYSKVRTKNEEANRLVYISFKFVLMITLPVVFGIIAIADEFIPFFYGSGYDKSITLLIILCFNIVFISITNLIGQQCLIAREKQKKYNIAIIISALINVILNGLLVCLFQSTGVSIASVAANLVSIMLILYMSKGEIDISELFTEFWKYLLSSVVMCVIVIFLKKVWKFDLIKIIIQIGIGTVIYFVTLLCLKETFMNSFMRKIKSKVYQE